MTCLKRPVSLESSARQRRCELGDVLAAPVRRSNCWFALESARALSCSSMKFPCGEAFRKLWLCRFRHSYLPCSNEFSLTSEQPQR